MLPPCDNSSVDSSNSSPNDVDASSCLGNNAFFAPLSQDQPLVDRFLSTINPDISQPFGALSNPVDQSTISRFVSPTSHTVNTNSIPL